MDPHGRARRWQSFAETVFTEFTALAVAHGAINLGQGSPGFDGPEFVKAAAAAAMARGDNQYAPMSGIPQLREVIASRFAAATGIAVDPDDNVTVTSGCAEALAASFLGMVDPGDEVVLIEPFYDLYPAGIAMAGATARHVTLRPPAFRLDDGVARRCRGIASRSVIDPRDARAEWGTDVGERRPHRLHPFPPLGQHGGSLLLGHLG